MPTVDYDPQSLGLYPVGVDNWGGFVFIHPYPVPGQSLLAGVRPRALRPALACYQCAGCAQLRVAAARHSCRPLSITDDSCHRSSTATGSTSGCARGAAIEAKRSVPDLNSRAETRGGAAIRVAAWLPRCCAAVERCMKSVRGTRASGRRLLLLLRSGGNPIASSFLHQRAVRPGSRALDRPMIQERGDICLANPSRRRSGRRNSVGAAQCDPERVNDFTTPGMVNLLSNSVVQG